MEEEEFASSSSVPYNRRFIFPPTIIVENNEIKNYETERVLPNLNMIIFFILIMLYDFAHDHIKSTKRIEPVDSEFLKICSQPVNLFKKDKSRKEQKVNLKRSRSSDDAEDYQTGILNDNIFDALADSDMDSDMDNNLGGGSSQKGGKLEYVEDCFSDMNNMLYFILFSIISYMDIEQILQDIKDTLKEPTKVEESKEQGNNDVELDLHYFCFVVNLIFTEYTNMDTNENLTHFILKNEKGELKVEEVKESSEKEIKEVTSTPLSKVSYLELVESSEKPINFISDNCAPNGIKLIKLSILQAVCELYNKNKDSSITLFQILLDPDFFYIFICFYLKQHGFGIYNNIHNDSFGNIILTKIVEKYFEKKKSDSEQIVSDLGLGKGVATVTPPGTPQRSTTSNEDYNEGKNLSEDLFAVAEEINQNGGNRNDIIQYLINKTKSRNPSIYLNNQVFRLYVCTVLTQLKILSQDPDNPAEFNITPFGLDLVTDSSEINVVNVGEQLDQSSQLPLHPTLYILRQILKELERVWNNDNRRTEGRNSIFPNYDSIESDLEDFFYRLSTGIPDFLGTFPSNPNVNNDESSTMLSSINLNEVQKEAYIYNNASNVLGYNDGKEFKKNYLPDFAENTDIIGKKNIIISDAAIIDAFGKTNIVMNDNLELLNRNFYVQGRLANGGLDDNNFLFNGVINIGNRSGKGEIVNDSTIKLGVYEQDDAHGLPFLTQCKVGVLYKEPFNFVSDNNTRKEYKQEKIQITTKSEEEDFVFDINDTLLSSELSNIRKFMLKKLVNLIDTNNIIDTNNNLFQNCYRDINGIIELISITLGKTECDLLQVLLTVLKDGGRIDGFDEQTNYISNKVIGYNPDGNGLRVISHNDLTASIITYFMLIFGYNKWDIKNITHGNGEIQRRVFIPIPYEGNTGKNDLAFLNDTRLSRFAVGNYVKLQEEFEGGISFKCVQFGPPTGPELAVASGDVSGTTSGVGDTTIADSGIGDLLVSNKKPKLTRASSYSSNVSVPTNISGDVKPRKRSYSDLAGGSKIRNTRRLKNKKNCITRKKNTILKKGTIKHYRKKCKTKRII